MTDSIAQAPIIVVDTVEYILKSDVTVFYADMMEKQTNQFTIILTAIGIIFAVTVGATWWWNYKGAKQQISEEISVAKQSLSKLFNANKKGVEKELKNYENQFNGFKGSLQKSVNNQIDEAIKASFEKYLEEFNKKVSEIDSKSTKQIEEIKQSSLKETYSQTASISRIFALYCTSNNSYLAAVGWWIKALKHYALSDNERWVGKSCEGLRSILEEIDLTKINESTEHSFAEDIKIIETYVPLSRQTDKKYFLKRLKEINEYVQKR